MVKVDFVHFRKEQVLSRSALVKSEPGDPAEVLRRGVACPQRSDYWLVDGAHDNPDRLPSRNCAQFLTVRRIYDHKDGSGTVRLRVHRHAVFHGIAVVREEVVGIELKAGTGAGDETRTRDFNLGKKRRGVEYKMTARKAQFA